MRIFFIFLVEGLQLKPTTIRRKAALRIYPLPQKKELRGLNKQGAISRFVSTEPYL